MNILDIRTVFFSYTITNVICLAVMTSLWTQNHRRSLGLGFWLADYGLQFLSLLFISLRGILPDFFSLVFGIPLNLLGTLLLFIGLESYLGKPSPKTYNFILVGFLSLLHIYFSFYQPNLAARNIVFSTGLLLLSAQIAWFTLQKVSPAFRRDARPVGLLFILYGLVSLARTFVDISIPSTNDLFKSGFLDTLTILIYQMLFIGLTFVLFLMVNRRLFSALETDISKRIQAENELTESARKFKQLFDNSPLGISMTGIDGTLQVNKSFCEILGYNQDELIARKIADITHPEDIQISNEMIKTSLDGNIQQVRFEKRYIHKSGYIVWVEVSSYLQRGKQGEPQFFITTINDISERKRAEEALKESEVRYRMLFNTMLDGFALHEIICDTDGKPCDYRFLEINPAFENMTGLKNNEIIGKTVLEVLPGTEAYWIDTYGKVAMSGQAIRFENYSGDIGKYYEVMAFSPRKNQFATIIADITERKHIDEALRESEYFLQESQRASRTGAYNFDIMHGTWSSTPVMDDIFGIGPNYEKTVDNWLALIDPGQSAEMLSYLQKDVLANKELFDKEYRIIRPVDQQVIWVYGRGTLTLNENGDPIKMIGTIQDITEKKRTETLLQLRLELLDFSNSHPLSELLQKTLDEVGVITGSPIGFYHFTDDDEKGLSLQTWSTRTIKEFCKTEGAGRHYPIDQAGVWADAIRTKKPVIHNDYAALPYHRGTPKGHVEVKRELVVPVLRSGKVVAILGIGNKPVNYNEKDIAIVTYFADTAWEIIERKRAEDILKTYSEHLEKEVQQRTHELSEAQEKLVRQERLAMLGQLAGSVSHELRNPLGVISNAVYYLRMAQPDMSIKTREYLGIIEKETHTADKIISDLLNFTRIKTAKREAVSVVDLIRDLLQRIPVPETISTSIEIPNDLPAVQVDPDQITQVLDNLITNACQAMESTHEFNMESTHEFNMESTHEFNMESTHKFNMEHGSNLEIKAQTDHKDARHFVRVSLKDNGPGILPENMPKLFEPLFTTKAKGIGLGLAICKSLVEANNGYIEVQSEPGQGSIFTIYLPMESTDKFGIDEEIDG